jgi:hypothetical protein
VVRRDKEVEDAIYVDLFLQSHMLALGLLKHVSRCSKGEEAHGLDCDA